MKGITVSDTGPIIAFAIIGRLDVLHGVFPRFWIPEAVHGEAIRILEAGSSRAATTYQGAAWVEVKTLHAPPDPLLNSLLHLGEACVIQLAREHNAAQVLIDERKARKIARDVYGLHVVGSARVLVEAKRRGLIPCVREPLQMMWDSGYWIADAIVDAACREVSEA